MNNKREKGQYFTKYNPFDNNGFLEWAEIVDLKNKTILEPFAGKNDLIYMLKEMNLCKNFKSFDIEPQDKYVLKRDTLKHFPNNYDVCITNPPYLARNSATRRNLYFPNTKYDDLYKYSLDKCLLNCDNVGAIIPASFLNSHLFRDRLTHYILLNTKMFNDTEHPVCLALFQKKSLDTKIYEGKNYIGLLNELKKKIPNSKNHSHKIKFNDKMGKLGLIAIDNTVEPSIKFCDGTKIDANKIKISSRSITRISLDYDAKKIIKKANELLNDFRKDTCDIFMTPFKGIRKDGKFRRRLDFDLAKKIINECLI